MQVTPMERRCSFKRQNSAIDDMKGDVKPIKRQDSDNSFGRPTVTADELWHLLQRHMASPLPECDAIFPWLHGYSSSAPPDYPNSISIIRSQPMPDNWIQNSGVLKCSMDPHEFLLSWATLGDVRLGEDKLVIRDIIIRELSRCQINLKLQEIEDVVLLCYEYGVLPFLNTDGRARNSYSVTRKVGNSHQQSVSGFTWRQPGSFRRFDIQPAKMLEMSSQIVVYCFHARDAHSNSKGHCSRCYKLATVLNLALKFVQANYLTGTGRQPKISILQYKSLQDIPPDLIGTPPMTMDSLNKDSPVQLVSPFDLVSFNNWDRDLLYREKLEVSKMSSATPVESSLSCWSGNSTDYQVYKLLLSDTKNLDSFVRDRLAYYSTQNSIVRIRKLQFDANDPKAADTKLFNIPCTPKPWALMIRCLEKVSPPSLEKVMASLGTLLKSANPSPIELNFPSSGTITLGSLNINSIEIILNICYVLYQLGNLTDYGSLIYCSDGYTETTFLLVAYLIFLWDLSLEDTLLELHLKYERPFFLFPVDLQVLGHLQSLLRQFSPKRPENYQFYRNRKEKILEPLEITPEMFSKIFLFCVPPDLNFSALKGPLPSRILSHLYLGSLEHAQSPKLLKKMGINYIVSVGEDLSWAGPMNSRHRASSSPMPNKIETRTKTSPIKPLRIRGLTVTGEYNNGSDTLEENPRSIDIFEQEGFKILRIANLGDNGKDSLTNQLEHILAFIDECYEANGKVLVHCMVGVSRSATVCIAECMKRLECSVLRAYLFVRVRRLNIIIQPNLMFMYELLKWQESQGQERAIDWPIICRSISELNNNYI
ncbi:ZYRO0G20856p [Zygosaccharomyces rouxii]|uniref:ZYRO0G20856p n=1 Tax=Zygosaccharomyces rouxii (strain ATCC 2623 / CBS 732 / NBRC 1130 / NCYC 568 / NRRL Y-229) TaxID=559307 RepID=C5E1G8_ZYGRC|nr:uncharacterized protein ZYRO0G20856g [Zygosaccharomyces rouxii]KAH9202942.1 hypothetical protein LQ764DRAFT_233003 [Zygosaccharomyces rouxii]CAR29952.1 ZYRO0G20856p [Zygosaccharomyces rouxii]